MKYLFDTDSISFFYDAARIPEHSQINANVSGLKNEDVLYISVLSLYELEYSFWNAPSAKRNAIRATIKKIERAFKVLPLQ